MNTPLSRRNMLKAASCGFGYLALAGLATEQTLAEQARTASAYTNPLAPRSPHFAPRAKTVIFTFMQGGPAHVDLFDYKPALEKFNGKTWSGSTGDDRRANGKILASPFKFKQHGSSGLPLSDVWEHLPRHADDICLINSCHANSPAHPQATIEMHTGTSVFVRPSVGSWMLYGLGTENQDLPGFVTINPPDRLGGAQNFGSAFLPASYQGIRFGSSGKAGDDQIQRLLKSDKDAQQQRKQIDLVQSFNREMLERSQGNQELEGVIESYELAFRMQAAVPQVLDFSSEPDHIKQMYGIDSGPTSNFGRQCLMARRLAEAGVRYIEICHTGWDQHKGLKQRLTANCKATDQPMAALLTDLKQRGMLNDTLVVWGGEFGRTPMGQGSDGRNHNARGFSMWMAGGGVKGGVRYGETDEIGYAAAVDKMHTHDIHATMLHLMGIDHEKLTYRYGGRDFRLTDVYGHVAKDILA